MNNSGKVATIFLSVIIVLLICVSAIVGFFLSEEVKVRKSYEYNLEQMRVIEAKLQANIKEATKNIFILEEKNKEKEDNIESLLEDIELEQGLREEAKKENRDLQEALAKEKEEKEALDKKMRQEIMTAEDKITSLQEKLDLMVSRNKELEDRRQELEAQYNQLEESSAESPAETPGEEAEPVPAEATEEGEQPAAEAPEAKADNIELEKIVVNSADETKGKVISVDKETDFLIVNLGEKDGIAAGAVLSIYRNEDYLGDVKVSRVLPEMSAADFVPPLESQKVKKDDLVILKQ